MGKPEWSLDELRCKSESYCVGAERCCSDMRIKLLQWGAKESDIDAIIVHLQHHKYIDEARYCNAFAHDKVNYQGWGKMKIKLALQEKRLPFSLIEASLEAIDKNQYNHVLDKIISSKKRMLKNDTFAREKLIRFCMQRGFTYSEISEKL